jgi:hypothetical protein
MLRHILTNFWWDIKDILRSYTRLLRVSELSIDCFKDGQIYFIKGWHLREFGFPRDASVKKKFKWKKMNFTTDLPKNNPICTYLVATGRVER